MAFDKLKNIINPRKRDLPGGLWMKCRGCTGLVYKKEVENRNMVCPECNYHYTLTPEQRIGLMTDDNSFREMWTGLAPLDPLEFKGVSTYKDKIAQAQKETGRKDAAIVGTAKIDGKDVVFGMTDSRFLMGSMGSVVGEKVARAMELGAKERIPVIIVSGSGGGARMYEGCLSLMQMAKTSAAIARLDQQGGLFISVLTNPTMAGVMASFAALGDVVIAEPGALIGFTGPRVIEQTIRQSLPAGFQTSEFLLEHGFLDMVVHRQKLKEQIAAILGYLV